MKELYRARFQEKEIVAKNAIWKVLCDDFFSKFIKTTDTVVDVGAGYCEFINNISCGRKIAIDINEDVKRFAAPDVEILNEPITAVSGILDSSVDVVFMSNFLEHLPGKKEVIQTILECRRILKSGGKIIILQPNIRFLADVYWDFFDHHVPLSDRSLSELLTSLSLKITTLYARFLPYTTKSRLPKNSFLIRWYVKCPWLWSIFGKQAFIVAEK